MSNTPEKRRTVEHDQSSLEIILREIRELKEDTNDVKVSQKTLVKRYELL